MSNPEEPEQKETPQQRYERHKQAFQQLNPDVQDRESVRLALASLAKAGFNRAVLLKVGKDLTGFGFNIKQITVAKEGQPPPSVEKALEQKVVTKIAEEATENLKQVLATGKTLEDALGPYAHFYGYQATSDFVVIIFDFWQTWKDQVKQLVEENHLQAWALREMLEKFTPEARKVLRDQAVRDLFMSVIVMGQQTGRFPPPETMKGYIEALREELMK